MKYKKYFRKTSLKQEGIGEHFLNEIASKKPKNFLEIGVFHGVTARNVCELCSASHFDNKIVDLCAEKFVEVPADEVSAAMRAQAGKEHPLTWRYLPAVGGFGAPSLSEVVTFPSENIFDSVMVGEGSVTWNTLTWEENPTQFHIVNTMERLPVVEYLPAILTRGRTNLVLPENWTRSLAPMGGA